MTERAPMVVPAEAMSVIRASALRANRSAVRFGDSVEDVTQDLLLHYLQQRHRYDPGRSSVATFAARVCGHRAIGMVAKASAQKRGGGVSVKSLSEPVAIGQAGENILLESTISADSFNMNLGRQTQPEAELRDLQIDIEHILAGVPPDVAFFARRLAYESVGEAARAAGLSRASAYRRVQKLRKVFAENGLDTYLTRCQAVGSKRRAQ
jgi:DNA-directed RNA polymerase specialized sigma24 family protein